MDIVVDGEALTRGSDVAMLEDGGELTMCKTKQVITHSQLIESM